MASAEHLSSATKKISCRDTTASKTKELMDLEMRFLLLEDLVHPKAIEDFLNSLHGVSENYVQFIQSYPAFFFLRLATLNKQLPLNQVEIQEASHLLKEAAVSINSILGNPTHPSKLLIDNVTVLKAVTALAAELSTFTPNQPPPKVPASARVLRCVEELYFSCYHLYWKTLHPIKVTLVKKESRTLLETWLILDFYQKINAVTEQKLPVIDNVAEKLIKTAPELFSSSQNLVTAANFQISKARAAAIISTFTNEDVDSSTSPVLIFNNDVLTHSSEEYILLYDFIIESLCHNQTHGCNPKIIEKFLKRGIKFLTSLSERIETLCTHKKRTEQELMDVKTFLLLQGLTKETCTTYKTIFIMIPHKIFPIPNLSQFVALVQHLTSFALFFYQGLEQYSPTSISFKKNKLLLQNIEETERSKELSTSSTPALTMWPIPPSLICLQVKVPKKTLLAVYTEIPSYIMKLLFLIYCKNNWHFTDVPEDKPQLLPTKNSASAVQVRDYCAQLSVCTTEEDVGITRSPYFKGEFIKTQLYPILKNILNNSLQKNRALMFLRWLILFGADNALSLLPIRKSLVVGYFQILSILSQQGAPDSLHTVLNAFQHVLDEIKMVVSDASFSTSFFHMLFQTLYTPIYLRLLSEIPRSLREMETLFEGVGQLNQLSTLLCKISYECDVKDDFIQIPTVQAGQFISITTEHFKKTLATIERVTKETVIISENLLEELQDGFADTTKALEESHKIENHPLGFKTLPLNFTEVHEEYVKCFRRLQLFFTKTYKSSCFNLLSYFPSLFDKELIPLKLADEVLNFSDQDTNLSAFVTSFAQIIHSVPSTSTNQATFGLTEGNISAIQELYADFPSAGTALQNVKSQLSIKQPYTASMNNEHISVDWSTFENTVFEVSDHVNPNLIAITSAKLDQALQN